MTQSGQATAYRSVNVLAGSGSTEVEAASQFLLSSAEAAVSHALGPADSTREIGSRTEAASTGNQGDLLSDHTRNNGVAAPVVSLPPFPMPAPRMATLHALQEWEGYVVEIGADDFVARLVDLTVGLSHESEEAIIPLVEISERDAYNMAVGSIFRWVIGYERTPEGTRKRVSQIVFRDLPRMTESDLRAGREWARRAAPALNP